MILDRFLSSSMVYPTDYGFLMGHRGRDGDPLDAMVCVSEATFPGCVIPVKPIALFKMRDEKGEDDKIVCVPTHDPGWNTAESLDDITEQLQNEITHFFSFYKVLEGKDVEVDGWRSREEALEVIEDGRKLEEEHRRDDRVRRRRLDCPPLQELEPTEEVRRQCRTRDLRHTSPSCSAPSCSCSSSVRVVILFVSAGNQAQFGSDFAVVGLVHAFLLFGLVLVFGGVSGGHFNPAVTLGIAAVRRIDPFDAAVYILAQLSGGVLGALLARASPRRGPRGRLRDARDQPDPRQRLPGLRRRGARNVRPRPRDPARGARRNVRSRNGRRWHRNHAWLPRDGLRAAHGRLVQPGPLVRPGPRRRLLQRRLGLHRSARSSGPCSRPRLPLRDRSRGARGAAGASPPGKSDPAKPATPR